MLHRRILAILILCQSGCYAATLTTRAVGCYAVDAPAWTPARAAEFGFGFPDYIELDSVFAADAPAARRGWPWHDDLHVSWDNTAPDWMKLSGDTIVPVPGRTEFHTLSNDSIRVRIRSRRDGFDAWLAPFDGGYRGLAHRVNWKSGRRESVSIELQRVGCNRLRAT